MDGKYSIESSPHPLAFLVRAAPAGISADSGVSTVEAHCLGVHQKEALAADTAGGALWRLTSDEGAMLGGSDLAPFPLAYWNGGLQLDLVERMHALARSRGLPVTLIETALTNRYAFDGSFYRGDGQGSAQPALARVRVDGGVTLKQAQELARDALATSPAHAAMAQALTNTFALYVNNRRVPVTGVPPSTAADLDDPFRKYTGAPQPLANAGAAQVLISKLQAAPSSTPVAAMPAAQRVEFSIGGTCVWTANEAQGRAVSVIERPGSTPYALVGGGAYANSAPSGLAYMAAGIAFCYMTQLVRYVEYLKYKVRAIRLAQTVPWRAGTAPSFGPVDTHLYLVSEEPDEVNQRLLAIAANTCYLHAALGSALTTQLEVTTS